MFSSLGSIKPTKLSQVSSSTSETDRQAGKGGPPTRAGQDGVRGGEEPPDSAGVHFLFLAQFLVCLAFTYIWIVPEFTSTETNVLGSLFCSASKFDCIFRLPQTNQTFYTSKLEFNYSRLNRVSGNDECCVVQESCRMATVSWRGSLGKCQDGWKPQVALVIHSPTILYYWNISDLFSNDRSIVNIWCEASCIFISDIQQEV